MGHIHFYSSGSRDIVLVSKYLSKWASKLHCDLVLAACGVGSGSCIHVCHLNRIIHLLFWTSGYFAHTDVAVKVTVPGDCCTVCLRWDSDMPRPTFPCDLSDSEWYSWEGLWTTLLGRPNFIPPFFPGNRISSGSHVLPAILAASCGYVPRFSVMSVTSLKRESVPKTRDVLYSTNII